ncbi:MAG: hypothetical protein VKM17_12120 [Cyanobacteriota bacterium]|nr:hypothetical protein [Cyanobacteriota bacterium]
MDRTPATPDSTPSTPPREPLLSDSPLPEDGSHHDFEAQKRIHQQIRNDPDYDDWEYGTEPLPHEAWNTARSKGVTPPAAGETP